MNAKKARRIAESCNRGRINKMLRDITKAIKHDANWGRFSCTHEIKNSPPPNNIILLIQALTDMGYTVTHDVERGLLRIKW